MSEYIMSQMHIEAARNSTDDFNLFHDKNRWHKIKENPFQGTIALGFQLGCFVEDQVNRSSKSYDQQLNNDVNPQISSKPLNFSQYELMFAGSVKPGDDIALVVRDGRLSSISDTECFSTNLYCSPHWEISLVSRMR